MYIQLITRIIGNGYGEISLKFELIRPITSRGRKVLKPNWEPRERYRAMQILSAALLFLARRRRRRRNKCLAVTCFRSTTWPSYCCVTTFILLFFHMRACSRACARNTRGRISSASAIVKIRGDRLRRRPSTTAITVISPPSLSPNLLCISISVQYLSADNIVVEAPHVLTHCIYRRL